MDKDVDVAARGMEQYAMPGLAGRGMPAADVFYMYGQIFVVFGHLVFQLVSM